MGTARIGRKLLATFLLVFCLPLLTISNTFADNDVTFTVNNNDTVLELNIPSSVDLRLTPTRGFAYNTANLNIGIGTNNSTGYSLSMTASSTDLTRTSSITDGNNNTSTPTIPTISTTYSPASFESSNETINKWGYKLSTASNFGPMTTTTQTLKETEGPSNATGSDVTLNFAAKVDTTLASGTYQTTLNFTAVTNAVPITNISQLTYMQEFAKLSSSEKTAVLASMTQNQQYTLKDSRDQQDYTIAKLADGKVWMTKNLNLAGGTTISCVTSDCDNYTIPTNQGWQAGGKLPASSTSGFNTNNYAYVYNSNSTTCGNGSPCYSYYSWDAATLGSGRNIATNNENAPYSICPKGWHLPTTYNGSGTAAEATDFRALMIAFGGSNSVQAYNSSTTPTGATMSTTLRSSPNNFLVAGGYNNGLFSGSYGYYWSATSGSSIGGAQYITFNSTDVNSASNYNRCLGHSVRCVLDS